MVWRCNVNLVVLLFMCSSLLETNGQHVRQKLQRRKSVDYFYEKPSYDFEGEDSKSKDSDKSFDLKAKLSVSKTEHVSDSVKSTKKPVLKEKSEEKMGVCETLTCPVGRVCMPGGEGQAACVCGGEDLCVGHKKRVCGTDGVWYPSHCELHRVACVQARHIGVDRDGKNCRSKLEAPLKSKSKVNIKAKAVHKVTSMKAEEKVSKVKDTPVRQPCTRVEYEQFKASLLKYHCARLTAADCTTLASRGRQVVSEMLTYYDTRKDGVLDADELMSLEHRDHVQRLSRICHLGDLITFDDIDFDGSLTREEFNKAFGPQLAGSSETAPSHFTTVTTAGGSLEIKCDSTVVKVGWRRGQYTLPDILSDAQIRIVADGSLYFGRVGIEHTGNYSCYDLATGATSQLHTLKVNSAPTVHVTPSSQFHREGATVTVHCHASALPQAQLSWTVNGRPVSPDNKHYRLMGHNTTLEVASAEFAADSGTFVCQASNSVGTSQATASVFVDNNEADKHGDGVMSREQFLVFHRAGYTVYDPLRCLLKHTVSASFSQLPVSGTSGSRVLCEGERCEWGAAINVRDRLVYVTQRTLNRVLVLDMDELGNVIEVIATGTAPSSVQYVAHLDQVWVMCDSADKPESHIVMVIRAASDLSGPHEVVHTEPVGGHYDTVKQMFVAEQSEVAVQWRHAYVLHEGQQGLSKLSLDTLKYTSDIDLKSLDCVPQHVTFLPIGGHVAVNCVTRGGEQKSPLVMIDALTDTIVSHTVPSGRPYVSPDGRRLVIVRDADNSITVSKVDDTGALEQLFVAFTDFKVAKVTFIPALSGQGYDLYATAATSATMLSVNLSTGHTNTITSTGGEQQLRTLVGGGEFGEFVMVSTSRGVMAVNGRQQRVQCRWSELQDADVIVWSEDRLFA